MRRRQWPVSLTFSHRTPIICPSFCSTSRSRSCAIYPAGRLDADSEGLMLLTDDGKLQHAIAHPDHKEAKTYLAQVDGALDANTLARLQAPIDLGDFITKPCKAVQITEPAWLWPRTPPIRVRADKPTSWIALTLTEGKNRQVRRMTAAVGLPTLRLVRSSIGPFSLATHPLLPGEYIEVPAAGIDKSGR